MALANYTDLKATVAAYLQRSDLTSYIPDFIALTEKKVARFLRTLEIQATATTTPMAETNTLPTDFLELVDIYITYSGNKYSPTFVMPDKMVALKATTTTVTGVPQFFTIRLGKTEYYPAPQAGTTFAEVMNYYQRIVPLATTATNWLLTNHPDIFLYGTLCEAESFVNDDPRMPLWKSEFKEALEGLALADDRKRFFKPVAVDLGLPGVGYGSIETGFQ